MPVGSSRSARPLVLGGTTGVLCHEHYAVSAYGHCCSVVISGHLKHVFVCHAAICGCIFSVQITSPAAASGMMLVPWQHSVFQRQIGIVLLLQHHWRRSSCHASPGFTSG